MTIYRWQGIDQTGAIVSGELAAANAATCKGALIKQNILPRSIKRRISLPFFSKNRIKSQHISDFTQQLATLINANIPVVKALSLIANDCQHPQLKNIIMNIKKSIASGTQLNQALRQHPQYFTELSCNLIACGEQTGTLDLILAHLATYLEKMAQQKHKIIKALLYPALVFIVTIVVTAILLIFVIPQFKTMFADFGAELPRLTQIIIQAAEFVRAQIWKILIGLLLLISALRFFYQHNLNFKHRIESLYLKIPVVGDILSRAIICRVTKTLSIAIRAGMPILQAITISANTAGNWHYQQALRKIAEDVANGKMLNRAMQNQKIFPSKVISLIALGEESGTLDEMLEKISAIYSNELDQLTEKINELIEPIIMAFLGIVIGGLIVGMYLPIFRMGKII